MMPLLQKITCIIFVHFVCDASYLWQVEKVVGATRPDLLEIQNAKKMLKVNSCIP